MVSPQAPNYLTCLKRHAQNKPVNVVEPCSFKEIVERFNQYQWGIISPTFDPRDLAKKLNGLTQPDIQEYKQHAHNAASQVSAEKESKELLQIIQAMKPANVR